MVVSDAEIIARCTLGTATYDLKANSEYLAIRTTYRYRFMANQTSYGLRAPKLIKLHLTMRASAGGAIRVARETPNVKTDEQVQPRVEQPDAYEAAQQPAD